MLLMLLVAHMAIADENPCQMLRNESRQIIAIGELPTKIMILTDNYDVLYLPKDALNANNTFQLGEAKYQPLEEVFPAFENSTHFQSIKNESLFGFIRADEKEEVIELVTPGNSTYEGIVYDMKNNTFRRGMMGNKGIQHAFMSKYGFCTVYGFRDTVKPA